jgi:hypothetical protein
MKDQCDCASCQLNKTCVYSCFFESHVEKDTEALPGRDRASHPFLLSYKRTSSTSGVLSVMFLGISLNYIPYVIEAVRRTSESGVEKERVRFTIASIEHEGKSFAYTMKAVEELSCRWPDSSERLPSGFLFFDSPCRIKADGKYIASISLEDFLAAMQRRMNTLTCLYGDIQYEIKPLEIPASQPLNQRWRDTNYYSVRQKESLKLGGVLGMIHIRQEPDEAVSQLINAAILFHAGKNVSFGLGKVHFEKEENSAL